MKLKAILIAGLMAAPLAACDPGGMYYPNPQPYPGGGYNGGYGGGNGGWTPNYNQQPNYGTMNLQAGFNNDPRVVNLTAGGNLSAQNTVGDNCRGYVTSAPDYRVNYSAGSLPLIISVASNADTTLIINAPDGQWYCDDDGGQYGLNPSVRFNYPQSGQYDIWVGTYSASSNAPASLYISELTSQ